MMQISRSLKHVVWLLLLWPLLGNSIEVTSAKHMALFEQMQWCRTTADQTLEQVIADGCDFKEITKKDLAPGFSNDSFWLRLTLHNTLTYTVERYLSLGHPRLQLVTFYWQTGDGNWQRTETGMDIPMEQRPLFEVLPILPISLAVDETRTVYIRVYSETTIQLNTELWEPRTYDYTQHRQQFYQVLILGSLFIAAGFSLMMFFNTQEKTYSLFAACLTFVSMQDACYSGLVQLYPWPPSLAFPLQIIVLTVGLALIFFALFISNFLGNKGYICWINRLLLLSTFGEALTTVWGCLVSSGTAVRITPFFMTGIVLSTISLLIISYHKASRPNAYLIFSCSILTLMLLYRIAAIFGVVSNPLLDYFGTAWCFLLITPLVLLESFKRTETLRQTLLLSRAETNARVKFMAHMSHEFRSPLNTILGYAELQERGIQTTSLQNNASHIKYSGRQLLSMIDEILEHTRVEAGLLKLKLAPVHWSVFMSLLVKNTEMMMQARGNRFDWVLEDPEPTVVIFDEHRLLQVLTNLISNANRYTENGLITLSCTILKLNNYRSRFTFSIHDTGTGIAPEELSIIFQPFVRGHAGQTSGIDGTGMGLAIAHQLVMLMGGDIQVESTLGSGSVFSFSIEGETAESQSNVALLKIGVLPRPYKVLVVDDDPNSCHVLSLLLADIGFDVLTTESGNAARQYLGVAIDLVITDQIMTDGDGWSVLQDWSLRKVPVILLSAAPSNRPADLSDTLQFRRSLMKPFDADVLLTVISEVLAIDWLPAVDVIETTPAKINSPPQELLAALPEMIKAGAVSDILEWLETSNEQYPEFSEFWQNLSKTVWTLDFIMLQKLMP
jgi:two-component system, sensor histidine kinase LadS